MLRPWKVRVRLLDSIGNQVAETMVTCTALDPGAACGSAYIVATADIKDASAKRKQALPKIHAVAFLVAPAKGEKK